MERQKEFRSIVLKIALPVTLQSLLQSSFSVIDQVMIGQLGSSSIAGIGLGGKFASLYSIILAAIAAAAGIMISQYMGARDEKSVSRSFYINMGLSIGLAGLFLVLCIAFPELIMGLYTRDNVTRQLASDYLRIFSLSFLPMAVSSMITTMFRCMEAAKMPLYASILALLVNTGLNYLLIFGKWIFPAMGVKGAALATVSAQLISCVALFLFFIRFNRKQDIRWIRKLGKVNIFTQKSILKQGYGRQYLKIIGPMLICEFMWSLGDNVYAAVYGNMGTDACAAMTMTVPVQTLIIGALSGLSQAAGILTGKLLGSRQYEKAYADAKKLMKYGFWGSILLSLLLIFSSSFYVKIYNVEPSVQLLTQKLLIVYALISPVKVQNMILGGGIIRSGGKTKYTMWIDITGTWLVGVPLAFLAAFVWNLPIAYVYFILSMEECVRLGISFLVFRKRTWIEKLA